MRHAYKKIQKGMPTNHNLSQERIDRLKEIGFQWEKVYVLRCESARKRKCRKVGDCNVPCGCGPGVSDVASALQSTFDPSNPFNSLEFSKGYQGYLTELVEQMETSEKRVVPMLPWSRRSSCVVIMKTRNNA